MLKRIRRAALPALAAATLLAAPAIADHHMPGEGATKGAQDGTQLSSPQRFLVEAAMGNLASANLGQLAVDRAQSQEVKDYGRRIMTGHSQANDQLTQLFEDKSLAFPRHVPAAMTREFGELSTVAQEQFDRRFMQSMVTHHEDALKKYRQYKGVVDDTAISQYIDKTIPALEQHLDEARKILRELPQTQAPG